MEMVDRSEEHKRSLAVLSEHLLVLLVALLALFDLSIHPEHSES